MWAIVLLVATKDRTDAKLISQKSRTNLDDKIREIRIVEWRRSPSVHNLIGLSLTTLPLMVFYDRLEKMASRLVYMIVCINLFVNHRTSKSKKLKILKKRN